MARPVAEILGVCMGLKDDMYTATQKFWAKVEKTDGCWWWTGTVDRKGYGINAPRFFGRVFKTQKAHAVAFFLSGGRRPEGKVLDHRCRAPRCVNPKHLRAVTSKENTLFGIGPSALNARKTECKRGHKLTKDNVSIGHTVNGTLTRRCKQCMSLYNKKYRAPGYQRGPRR